MVSVSILFPDLCCVLDTASIQCLVECVSPLAGELLMIEATVFNFEKNGQDVSYCKI